PGIPRLVGHFAARLTDRGGLQAKGFDADALKRLVAHDWPGNIRELRNAVERLLILAPGATVTLADVERVAGVGRGDGGGGTGPVDVSAAPWMRAAALEELRQGAGRTYILARLQEEEWRRAEKARTSQ